MAFFKPLRFFFRSAGPLPLPPPPALETTTISLTCGELTKNCISTPMRCTTFRRTKDVSGPRRRTEMSTPENEVGACVRLTVTTEPGRTRSGCDLEKRVPINFCFSVDGRVCWRYAMRPLPWRRAGRGESGGGGGIMATWEYG